MALLTSGVLALPLLAGCSSGEEDGGPVSAGPDIASTVRAEVTDGGVLRWAVDSVPGTLNAYQADADATTSRIAGAVLPHLFTLDAKGRPAANPDYLEKAEVVAREPKQVVLYKLNQKAVWSDGREIGAPDFVAQWRALNGKDSAYWTARNAGYDRIEKIERGANDLEVRVTFAKPYADWQSLFSPLYPRQVTSKPEAFNEGAREALKVTAGPFAVGAVDKKAGTVTLARSPRWWGAPAKLDTLVLTAVPRAERASALASGKVDLAELDRAGLGRIELAKRDAAKEEAARQDGAGQGGAAGQGAPAHGPGTSVTPAEAMRSWALAHGADEEKAAAEREARRDGAEAVQRYAAEQKALRGFTVRRSLEPAYTQLALNGASGPLTDERVRRAIARALDRQALAEIVLKPLGLPAKPVGSHLALAGQRGYTDNSGALGKQDTKEAQALLADAGWRRGASGDAPAGTKAGGTAEKKDDAKQLPRTGEGMGPGSGTGNDGLYIVGQSDQRNGDLSSAAQGARTAADQAAVGRLGRAAPVLGAAFQGARAAAAANPARPAEPGDEFGPEGGSEGLPEGPARPEAVPYGPDGEIVDADRFAAPEQYDPGQAGQAGQAGNGQAGAASGGADRPGRPGPGPDTVLAPAPLGGQHDAPLLTQADTADDGKRNPARDGDAKDANGAKEAEDAGKASGAPAKQAAAGATGVLAKDGKPLSLKFVLPSGAGSEPLRAVGERISQMLRAIGIKTELTKVSDESFFKDHIASGAYDLALYSWPTTAFPATDARPIYAKPLPAADGSLLVEQNYTRVGTDRIDQLFDQAVGELDEAQARELIQKADARIWAVAGSIPLYQRPELVGSRPGVVNAGAFGLGTPRYQDIGWKKPAAAKEKNGKNK
ncbi:ABC transporter substrate-binding protein [Streptomyces sp. NPDC089799]|uniref:ABC transporter substrate-binding protein n=1 Tax=Streptomyces sp. NPDC089799 TaxID=3155066 RepID=UPI003428CDE4